MAWSLRKANLKQKANISREVMDGVDILGTQMPNYAANARAMVRNLSRAVSKQKKKVAV